MAIRGGSRRERRTAGAGGAAGHPAYELTAVGVSTDTKVARTPASWPGWTSSRGPRLRFLIEGFIEGSDAGPLQQDSGAALGAVDRG